MDNKRIKIGILGCTEKSDIYFKTLRNFGVLDIDACGDIVLERAKQKASEYNIPKAYNINGLLSDPEINIVVNLTVPNSHAEIALAALTAGKSVYNEKPLAVNTEDAGRILKLAKDKKLLVGCAPDTFLGTTLQTCRKLIDEGLIGEPIAANAFMLCPGYENWHPEPAYLYQPGSGPMFEIGIHYITALINLIGPVRRVTGLTRTTYAERTIISKPQSGLKIKVNTPTYIAGIMNFINGAIGTIVATFDVAATQLPHIEIYGTKGTLSISYPGNYEGAINVKLIGDEGWKEVQIIQGYFTEKRGIGIADMACALISGRQHRANGELAYHVLEIMNSFFESSIQGKHIDMQSTCERSEPLPKDITGKFYINA